MGTLHHRSHGVSDYWISLVGCSTHLLYSPASGEYHFCSLIPTECGVGLPTLWQSASGATWRLASYRNCCTQKPKRRENNPIPVPQTHVQSTERAPFSVSF